MASLESDEGRFVSYFLLTGDMVNGRGWGVTSESILKNIKTFKGMPFTVTSNDFIENSPYGEIYDHPSLEHLVPLGLAAPGTFDPDDEPLLDRFQNKFRIGEIIDIFEKDGVWRAIVQKDKAFEDRVFPPFTSPSLIQEDLSEPEGQITKWHGKHLTGLNEKPAYGSIAIKKGECAGPLSHCATELRNGSMGVHFKSARGPTFAGFSDIRECIENNKGVEKDPKSYCFAHIEGGGNKKAKGIITPCQINSLKELIRIAKIKSAALISPSVSVVNKLNVLGCKMDKKGQCKKRAKTY